MTAIEHNLVSRSAINVSLIDLMTSNQINGGNKILSLRHKETLITTFPKGPKYQHHELV